jgi:hypothetical protein
MNGTLSAGGIAAVTCFDPGLCTGYNVAATASTDSVCHGSIQLNAVATTGSSVFEWTPAGNLSDPHISNPTVNYSFNQDFIVTATDTLTGCFTNDTVFGISAMNDFTETFKTCGSFTYDFIMPGGADSYLWTSYTDSTGTTFPINDSSQLITTIPAPAIYYGTADFGGCIVNCTYILADTCLTLGITESNSGVITVYPNPAHSYLLLSSNGMDIQSVKITDLSGKYVYEALHSGSQISITTSGISTGIYFLEIKCGNKIVHSKVQIE